MKIAVDTKDLRAALRAVTPHAEPSTEIAKYHRVRIEVGPDDVTVSATNGYSAGHAVVDLVDNEDGELASFDLSPQQVGEILFVFKPAKSGGDDVAPDETLLLEADGEHVVVTDIGGLFPGKQLELPRYPDEDNFPDVQALIAGALLRESLATERLITSGKLLGLFLKASTAYGHPLVIDASGDAGILLISCGESFIGLLQPQRPDDERTAEIADWHRGWLKRIGERAPEMTR